MGCRRLKWQFCVFFKSIVVIVVFSDFSKSVIWLKLTSGMSSASPVLGLPGAQPGPYKMTRILFADPEVDQNVLHTHR